jgi:CRP-like cAMP-binding protein
VRLAEFAMLYEYRRGARIIQPRAETNLVFIIGSGEVRLYRQAANGREITALVLRRDNIFGEIFMPGTPATAASSTTVYLLQRQEVERATVISLLNELQQLLLDRLEDIALHDAPTLLARLFLERDHRSPGTIVMDTHEEVASRVGARQDHISRILTRFRREGLIFPLPQQRGITIGDREGLHRYAD